MPDIYDHASCFVIEAARRPAPTDAAWLEHVFDAWSDTLASWDNVRAFALHQGPEGDSFAFDDAEVVTRFLESPRTVEGYIHISKARDIVGIVIRPVPCTSLVLLARGDGPITLDRDQKRALERVSLHLESSYRLQHLGVGAVVAEVSKDGDITRFDDAALGLWQTLVEGRASLVETAHGSRAYRVVSNPSHARRMRGLKARELDILARAARGATAKSITYALGISASLVSNALASGAMKLGVTSRTELVRVAALLGRDPCAPSARVDPTDVTSAEREVLDLVREGFGNQEIARRRGRSIRTVANQVASLLRKTGRASRRALVVP